MTIGQRIELLRRAYRLFDARDVEALLALMLDDVEWPDVAHRSVLHGKQAIRSYWLAQFAAADPRVTPIDFAEADGDVVVTVDQRVLDHDGRPLGAPVVVRHRYTFQDDLIRRMTVERPPDEVRPRQR
jgi:ketosteroid isomerase-like protein